MALSIPKPCGRQPGVLGGLIGLPALALGKLEIGLSMSVGVLMGGLVFGWLRLVDRRFGRIPEATLWLFDSVGLAAFLADVGLSADSDFVQGLRWPADGYA